MSSVVLRSKCVPSVLAMVRESMTPLSNISSPPPTTTVRDSLTVFLDVSDQSNMTTIQKYITDLYTTAAETNFLTHLDIVPTTSTGTTLRNDDIAVWLPKMHDHVAMGGTFDRLHGGHKVLLTMSCLQSTRKLRIGVTTPAMLTKKKHAELIEPLEIRCQKVLEFVTKIRPELEYDVVPLTEPSGGVNTIPDVLAMVVSPETVPSAIAINETRTKNGLSPVDIVTIEYVGNNASALGDDFKLSSSALRAWDAKHA
eukprot:PhF_6_TR9719/c0_g1_i1/m.14960/K02318/COASY; phosphopantetheine adenylyltransferase / dephospho-CoA kinase